MVILDLSVGGERILISRAVPRRMGTRGVSSRAMIGFRDEVLGRPSPGTVGCECAGLIS